MRQRISDRRTQIYLPEDLYLSVKQKAKAEDVSMAEVIREALEEKVKTPRKSSKKQKKHKAGYSDLLKLSGSIKGGPRDFSENISHYLKKMYEEKYP